MVQNGKGNGNGTFNKESIAESINSLLNWRVDVNQGRAIFSFLEHRCYCCSTNIDNHDSVIEMKGQETPTRLQ